MTTKCEKCGAPAWGETLVRQLTEANAKLKEGNVALREKNEAHGREADDLNQRNNRLARETAVLHRTIKRLETENKELQYRNDTQYDSLKGYQRDADTIRRSWQTLQDLLSKGS